MSLKSTFKSLNRKLHQRQSRRWIRDENAFSDGYRQLTEQRFTRRKRGDRRMGDQETVVEDIVRQLRETGFARWPGFLSAEQIASGNDEMERLEAKWHEHFADACDNANVDDAASGATYTHINFAEYRRLRVNFLQSKVRKASSAPVLVGDLLACEPLSEVASRYFDHDTTTNYLLAERLEPSPKADNWHIDRIVDQLKVMILLTDVTPDQGPLRYKLGTHRPRPELMSVYHRMFGNGVSDGYLETELAERLSGEVVFGTGKAGDALFFDTLGVHSGTMCRADFRRAYVTTFTGKTRKTRQLLKLSPQNWI